MKSCSKLTTFNDSFQMLKQGNGEDCLRQTQCYEWYQRSKSGRKFTEDDRKTGEPFTSADDDHIEKLHIVVRVNRRLIAREVREKVEISTGSCSTILSERLYLRPVLAGPCLHISHGPRIFDEARGDSSRNCHILQIW
jgi:hypothetical protein